MFSPIHGYLSFGENNPWLLRNQMVQIVAHVLSLLTSNDNSKFVLIYLALFILKWFYDFKYMPLYFLKYIYILDYTQIIIGNI